MAVEETEFTQVFRGYDKDEVDKALGGLRRDIIAANTQAADAAKENKRLLARIEELTAELEEVGSPTFSGLGTKLENTLRVAEEQSTRRISPSPSLRGEGWGEGKGKNSYTLAITSISTSELPGIPPGAAIVVRTGGSAPKRPRNISFIPA